MLFPPRTEVCEVPDLYGIEISKTLKQVYRPPEILGEGLVGGFSEYVFLEKQGKSFIVQFTKLLM